VLSEAGGSLSIKVTVFRGPGSKAIHVAIHHAEIGRDKHGVVDLEIGRALRAGLSYIFGSDMLAASLNVAGTALQSQNKNREARNAFLSAAENLQDALGPDHLDTRSAWKLAKSESPRQ
jgi:hypothetical protein